MKSIVVRRSGQVLPRFWVLNFIELVKQFNSQAVTNLKVVLKLKLTKLGKNFKRSIFKFRKIPDGQLESEQLTAEMFSSW